MTKNSPSLLCKYGHLLVLTTVMGTVLSDDKAILLPQSLGARHYHRKVSVSGARWVNPTAHFISFCTSTSSPAKITPSLPHRAAAARQQFSPSVINADESRPPFVFKLHKKGSASSYFSNIWDLKHYELS